LHNLHPIKNNVSGVNGVVDTYIVTTSGSTDHFWSLNLSPLPGEQKRLISVTAASTFLLNYASNHYPGKIKIDCNEITPTKN
jgi:hypothetical protein